MLTKNHNLKNIKIFHMNKSQVILDLGNFEYSIGMTRSFLLFKSLASRLSSQLNIEYKS